MIFPAKRTASSYVSDKFWKLANQSRQQTQEKSSFKVPMQIQGKQIEEKTEPIQNQNLENISNTKKFSFDFLNIERPVPQSIIKKETSLASRGLSAGPKITEAKIFPDLNVENSIVPELYVFKKRIVSSKQIEKKIENEEYHQMLLTKKSRVNSTNSDFKRENSRLYSAIPVIKKSANRSKMAWKLNSAVQRDSEKPIKIKAVLETTRNDPFENTLPNPTKRGLVSSAKAPAFKIRAGIPSNNPIEKGTILRPNTCNPYSEFNLKSYHKQNLGNNFFVSTIVNSQLPLQNQKELRSTGLDPSKSRPLSSIRSLFTPQTLFSSSLSHPPEILVKDPLTELQPLFDFKDGTVFVSLIFKEQKEHSRPSDRIGLFMQISSNLTTDHIRTIRALKKGTKENFGAQHQLPIQFSLFGLFEEGRQPRDQGICFYLDRNQMHESLGFSLFPEFVSNYIMKNEGLEIAVSRPLEENEQRFLNREKFYLHILELMNQTYDPQIFLDRYELKRQTMINDYLKNGDLSAIALCESSIKNFKVYCSENYIPKSKIPAFSRILVNKVLSNFSEKVLKINSSAFKNFFKEIFEDYISTQREIILRYHLRWPKERERLKIFHLPYSDSLPSSEIIAQGSGYHSQLFKSWNSTFANCGKFLLKSERLLNYKILALKNWLAEFERIDLVENHFVKLAAQNDVLSNAHGFVRFQTSFLSMFGVFGESILKRGLLSLWENDFYLKPVQFGLHGHFDIFGYSALSKHGKSQFRDKTVLGKFALEVFNSSANKSPANLIELYLRSLRMAKRNSSTAFDSLCLSEEENDVFNIYNEQVSFADVLAKCVGGDITKIDSEPFLRIFCNLIEDFVVETITKSFQSFYNLVSSNADRFGGKECFNQPLMRLELLFDENKFRFNDCCEDVVSVFELYFERLANSFDFIFDIFDFTTSSASDPMTAYKLKQKRAKGANSVKTDQTDLIMEAEELYQSYFPLLVVIEKARDEEEVLGKDSALLVNRNRLLSRERVSERISATTSKIKEETIRLVREQYGLALQLTNDFSQFKSLLNRNFENEETPEFIRPSKVNPLAFANLVIKKNKAVKAANIVLLTDKLKKQEIRAFRAKLSNYTHGIDLMPPSRFFPLFFVSCSSAISSIRSILGQIEDSLCKQVGDRLLLGLKSFLSRYAALTDVLRKEVACSADYAFLRRFSVEVDQERLILQRRTKEIIENIDFFLSLRAARVSGTELLEQMQELAAADALFKDEIEASLERGNLSKAAIERQLVEDKRSFQDGCAELLAGVQFIRNVNDVRNSGQYAEEIGQLAVRLSQLRADFEEINQKENDIYERNFKTGLLGDLEDLILPSKEVWTLVSQTLANIKRTNSTHVCQLQAQAIEAFVGEAKTAWLALKKKPLVAGSENLGSILKDFQLELEEFEAELEVVRVVCLPELRLEHWQEYFGDIVADFDFQFFTLKIFNSYFSEENRRKFELLCQRAIKESQIKIEFEMLKKSFENTSVQIRNDEKESFFAHPQKLIQSVFEISQKLKQIVQANKTNYMKSEIETFQTDLERILNLMPLLTKLQPKLDFFKQLFDSVEHTLDIQAEYNDFMNLLIFNRNLRDEFETNGLAVFQLKEDLEKNIKINLSRLEIMENHPNPALFGNQNQD